MHGHSLCFREAGAPSKDHKVSDKDVRKTVINSQQLCLRISHFQNIKHRRIIRNIAMRLTLDTEAANSSSLHRLV